MLNGRGSFGVVPASLVTDFSDWWIQVSAHFRIEDIVVLHREFDNYIKCKKNTDFWLPQKQISSLDNLRDHGRSVLNSFC